MNEIINIDNQTISDITILSNIIKVIGWCIFNSGKVEQEYLNFINAIQWICNSIEYFMTELKIPKITDKQYIGLIRSSYKLCPNKSNCIYQYSDSINHNNCKYQHFPYDNLFLDCNSILQYITELNNPSDDLSKTSKLIIALAKNKDINGNELKRCLTTLNFVFLIMYRELDTIDKIHKNDPNYDIRKYHSYHTLFKYDNNRIEYKHSKNSDSNRSNHKSFISYGVSSNHKKY